MVRGERYVIRGGTSNPLPLYPDSSRYGRDGPVEDKAFNTARSEVNACLGRANASFGSVIHAAGHNNEGLALRKLADLQHNYQDAIRAARKRPELRNVVVSNAEESFRALAISLKQSGSLSGVASIAENYWHVYSAQKPKAKKAVASMGIVGLIGSILVMSSNMTGNVIGNMTQTTTNLIGALLFLVGIIGAFAYFKRR
jgi:hypothetical protein